MAMSRSEVSFTVQGLLPLSMNRLLRCHWAKRLRMAEEFCMAIKASISKEDIRVLKAWVDLNRKVSVKIEVSNGRLFDEDNLNALAKGPLDFMVAMRWLKNDSPEWVCFEKPSQKLGKKAITFRISPVEQP